MSRQRLLAIAVGAVVLVAVVTAVLATGFLGDGDRVEEAVGDRAGPSADADARSAAETATASTESTTTSAPGDAGATASTTAAPGPEVTTDTVEVDESPVPLDPESQEDDSEAPFDTQPTVPPPTTGHCEITVAALTGQIGPIELGDDGGACGDIGATIQPVVPQDDLADTDWGRDLRVCEKHPAAEGITVTVLSGGGAIELAPNLSRTADEGAADPIVAVDIAFGEGVSGGTSPRPIVVCRTTDAELSIVHHPTG